MGNAVEEKLRLFDLVFVIDGTSSMHPYIKEVKARVTSIVQNIERSEFDPQVNFGIVVYGDHPPMDKMLTETFRLTSDIAQIKENVAKLPTCNGGDWAEAVADGLHEAITLNWRENAGKVIILIGDAAPHGYTYGVLEGPLRKGLKKSQRDYFPAGCPCGMDPVALAKDAAKLGMTIYAVGVGTAANGERESSLGIIEGIWRILTRLTEGAYMTLSDTERLQGIVMEAIEDEMKKMAMDAKVLQTMQVAKTTDTTVIGSTLRLSKEEVNKTMRRLETRKLTALVTESEATPKVPSGGRFCKLCGKPTTPGARFCRFCGSTIAG